MELLILPAIVFGGLIFVAIVEFGVWGVMVAWYPSADWGSARRMLIFAAVVFPVFTFLVQLIRSVVDAAAVADVGNTGFLAAVGTPAIVFAVIAINIWALTWWTRRTSSEDR